MVHPEPMHKPNPSDDGPYRLRYASEARSIAPALVFGSFLDTSIDPAKDRMKTARDRVGDTC